MSKHLLTIARFGTPFQANMAKNRLEAEGIPAFLADEQTVGNLLLYGAVLGGVKLLVPLRCYFLLSVKTSIDSAFHKG